MLDSLDDMLTGLCDCHSVEYHQGQGHRGSFQSRPQEHESRRHNSDYHSVSAHTSMPHVTSSGLWPRPSLSGSALGLSGSALASGSGMQRGSNYAMSNGSWQRNQRPPAPGEERWHGGMLHGPPSHFSQNCPDEVAPFHDQYNRPWERQWSQAAAMEAYMWEQQGNATSSHSRGLDREIRSELRSLASKVEMMQSELHGAVKRAQSQQDIAASSAAIVAQAEATASMNATLAALSMSPPQAFVGDHGQLSRSGLLHGPQEEQLGNQKVHEKVFVQRSSEASLSKIPVYQLSSTRSRCSTHRLEEELEKRERQHEAAVAELQKQIAQLRSKEVSEQSEYIEGVHKIDLELSLSEMGRATRKLGRSSVAKASREESASQSWKVTHERSHLHPEKVDLDDTGNCELPIPMIPTSRTNLSTARSDDSKLELQHQLQRSEEYYQIQVRAMQCQVKMLEDHLFQLHQGRRFTSSELQSEAMRSGQKEAPHCRSETIESINSSASGRGRADSITPPHSSTGATGLV